MNDRLYTLTYEPDGHACPHFLDEEADPDEWEWDTQDPRPFDVDIKKRYSSKITDREITSIDFDFYGSDSKYVSDRFVDVCRACGVNFRLVPIDIQLWDGSRPTKIYFVFLPADHLAILDAEQAIAEPEVIPETGGVMTNRFFPSVPVYRKIEKFAMKDIAFPALFQCVEINALVCTDGFRQMALAGDLRGLRFTPLDEHYVYDPWAGL